MKETKDNIRLACNTVSLFCYRVEDETMKDEHIRVVVSVLLTFKKKKTLHFRVCVSFLFCVSQERKLFVASKAKSSQPWYNPRKRANEEMQQNHEQTNAACKISMWRPLSKGTQSSKTKESDKILGEAESIDKSVTKSRNFTAETGMGMTDRSPNKGSRASGFLFREKRKMLGNDIDAKCHGLIAEQYTGVDEQTCLGDNDDTECHRIKVKKKKKQKDRGGDNCVEEGKGLPADPSRSPIITEAEKAQDTAKKKKHEYLGQAAHGQSEEDSVLRYEAQIGCMEGRKNKKGNDDTDSVKTSKVAESTTKDGLVLKKRKKRDKDRSDSHQTPTEHPETIDHSANGKTSEETLESSGLKRKKHKKKKKKKSLCNDHRTDVNFSNSATTLAENTDFVKVKKLSEVAKLSEETQTEKQEVEPESRKKKKVKDDTSIIYPEDMLTSCDYSELVHKKNKRRNPSFLCADAEEQLASGREGRAEKREVSAGELAADSADVSEHSLEPRGGKKKKKRSAAVPESEEREPEETPEAGVRKKKKRKRTESLPGSLESVADEGRSQTEEAVVVRKKKKNKKNKGTQEVPPAATEDPAAEKSTPGACSSLSASQKLLMEREGKHKGGGETSCDSSLSTLQQATKTLTEGASDLHASGDVNERKKKKSADSNAPGGKPCTHTANTETRKTKTEDRTKPPADPRFTSTSPKRLPAEIETSSSQCVMGKRVRAKRRLHNPNTDFLSDL